MDGKYARFDEYNLMKHFDENSIQHTFSLDLVKFDQLKLAKFDEKVVAYYRGYCKKICEGQRVCKNTVRLRCTR